MGIFATRSRGRLAGQPVAGAEPPDAQAHMGVPQRFEAVGEALAVGRGSVDACAVLGQGLAKDGASLDEALEGLRATALHVTGREPSYDDTRALATAWSETMLAFLHHVSCEEPLTGLASLAHVRSRLSELHRRAGTAGGPGVRDGHALVLVELPREPDAPPEADDAWRRSLRLARIGELARTVFPGGETIGRLGLRRVVVVAERDDRLGRRVALLRELAGSVGGRGGARVWIEGVPGTDDATAALLDELAR